jgi:transposase-like protein
MDDQEYNAAMVEARNEFRAYRAAYGLVAARKLLPGIDDARRRFREHKADKGYRLNGQDSVTAYIRWLGYEPATVRKWRQRLRDQDAGNTGAENRCGNTGKQRDRYDATDIAHLERVVRAAQNAADAHPDDDAFDSIRHAIENKPEGMPEVGSHDQIVALAVEGSEIIFSPFGDRLLGSVEGNRLVQIAREIIALSRKRSPVRRRARLSLENRAVRPAGQFKAGPPSTGQWRLM